MQVMTVTGPIHAQEMGATDAHDHLFLRTPVLPGEEIEDPEVVAAELDDARRSGLRTVIELTPIGLAPRPALMGAVSIQTGMSIVAATGYHRDAHYPDGDWVLTAPDDLLLERMTTDLTNGMDQSSARAGVIKAGASLNEITDNERRRLICAAEAAKQTGVAVVVHTEAATCGREITDLLTGAGLPAEQIILAHMDRDPTPARHVDLLARGIFLVYDTIGRAKYHPDSARIDLIEAVCAAGYADRVLLGLDIGRASTLHVNGGYGLRYLMNEFVPRLRERIGEAPVQEMLVENAATAFALRTPVAA
jgi:phosphotriesterase-related protein